MFIVYDYIFVKIFDSCMVDILFVGDFFGMVIFGYDFIIFVIMDDMEYYVKVVVRGVKYFMVVVDMLFLLYYIIIEDVVKNVGRLICVGVYVVKMEGCDDVYDKIEVVIKV